jgi:Family of unknown function (DUF6134)
MNRRQLLGLLTGASAAPLLAPLFPVPTRAATPRNLRYGAFHHGLRVGEHVVEFQLDGERLAVRTHIDITIKVLFFTVFHFIHDAEEVWQSGRLASVESTTNDNGTLLRVSGSAAENGFRILSGAVSFTRAG